MSTIGYKEYVNALAYLVSIKASVKYLSIEPLLSWDRVITNNFAYSKELGHAFKDNQLLEEADVGWLIVGQVTPVKKATMPKIEWIREIVEACDKAGIAVFQKNNLRDVFVQEAIKQNPIPDHCYPTWARDKDTGYLRQELPQ